MVKHISEIMPETMQQITEAFLKNNFMEAREMNKEKIEKLAKLLNPKNSKKLVEILQSIKPEELR